MCYCSVQCCHDMEKRAEKDRWRIRFGQYTCTRRPPNQNWWRLMCSSPKGGWEIMNTLECKFKCIHETELYPTKTSVIVFSVQSSCHKEEDAQICQMQSFSGHACPLFPNCISQLYFTTVFLREKWKMLRSASSAKLFGTDLLCLSIWHTAHSSWLGNHHCSEVCSLKCAHMQCHVTAELTIEATPHNLYVQYGGNMCNKMCEVWVKPSQRRFLLLLRGRPTSYPPLILKTTEAPRTAVHSPPLLLYPKPQRHTAG